jgi:signal transduction histidine kinase
MKRKLSVLSRRYLGALRKHLNQGPRASLCSARALGRQAVAIGLETLDLARIHEHALGTVEASSRREGLIKRAELFFKDAISPIEETHRASVAANARLQQLNQKLDRRTLSLAASQRSLQKGIARRKSVEAALQKSGGHYRELLEGSLALQRHLQHLTHRILSAQEHKRTQMSHELQDEIAQTLLGINVRLLTVQQAVDLKDQGLEQKIGSTQRLVRASLKGIYQFAREIEKPHEA